MSELALRSKAYWGYSDEFMSACENELRITPDKLDNDKFLYMVAESEGKQLGYYALEIISESEYELDALFVDPEHIGSGIGRELLSHAKQTAAKLGGTTLIVQSDPNARNFYQTAGGVLAGMTESASIPGRFLPTFSISLVDDYIT